MDKEKLVELAKKVAKCRMSVEIATGQKDIADEDMLKTNEGITFQTACTQLLIQVEARSSAESELKSAVLEVYKETEERKPIDKVEVKIFTHLEYDDAEVLTWCKTNAPALLQVDKKTFEKTAVKMKAPVEVKEDSKCTIAKDLSIYLDAVTESA